MPSACRLRRVDRVVWAREAKEARVEPRRARDTSEGNAAPAADRNRQETEALYKLGHIEILWSTRATEMRPSPPHRRELASRNENTVTRASSTAPGTSRGASPHRLQTRLAAKRHSWRRKDAKRYAVPSRSNPLGTPAPLTAWTSSSPAWTAGPPSRRTAVGGWDGGAVSGRRRASGEKDASGENSI